MGPVVQYTLTEEAHRNYEKLLKEQGVDVRPFRKETEEDLLRGTITYRIHGALHQSPREFPYTSIKNSKECLLNLEPFGQGADAADAIMAAVGRAFPQPERRREPVNFWNYGCLLVVLFIVAVIVFAIIGVISVFR